MLYPYQTAEEHRAPLQERALLRQPAGLLALELVCTINDLFTAAPSLLYQEGTKGLLLLYRDSACDTSYLEEECRELMACLSSHWETALYGTAPGGETGELTFHLEEGNRILCRTRCVSGRPFDQLSGLCVKLEADSSEHAARLRDVLGQIRYNARCCAVDRRAGAFLDENEILEDQDGSLYRYLTLEGDPSPIDYLQALSLEQKQHLWRIFLRDGEQPMEFAWLHEFAQEGAGFCMMEWELTLQQVLDELEFQIINQPGQFYILDPSGKQITFDFIRGCPAEKVFLKILFPVVIPHGR